MDLRTESKGCRIGIAERQGSALLVKDLERLADMVHEATGE